MIWGMWILMGLVGRVVATTCTEEESMQYIEEVR